MLAPIKKIQEDGDMVYVLYRGEKFPCSEGIEIINYKEYLKQ
jgi:hypothetical protein